MTTAAEERRGTLYGIDVVRSYGDAAAEYRALRDGCGVVVREDRRIVRARGRDPVKMVHGLVTNDVLNAPPMRAVYAALLTPKGRMVGEMRVMRHGADLLFDVDAGALDGVLAHLKKYVPPLFARFEDVSSAYEVLGVYGAASPAALARITGSNGLVSDEDAMQTVSFEGAELHVIGTRLTGGTGFDVIVPAERRVALHDALLAAGSAPAGHAALDVLRIEAGVPRWGAELDEAVIPLEAGLQQRAISTSKGCYTGQEVIIRILHRGHVNWQLRGLLLGEHGVPAHGTTLTRPGEDKTVARVTSACVSPRLDQTIALAYVRREVEPGAELTLENHTARVVVLPFAS